MTRASRNATGVVLAFAGLGLLVPTLAQRTADSSSPDVNRAKQIVRLIEQGQLDLGDATTIAEKHIKGRALGVKCTIRGDEPDSNTRERSHARGADERQPQGAHLVYDITCFAKDKVQTLQVDGLTKEVVAP